MHFHNAFIEPCNSLKPPSMHWLACRTTMLYKTCRNTYKNIGIQVNWQKSQPLSFSFFFNFNIPSPPPPQISKSRVLLYSLLLQTNYISAFKNSLITQEHNTWHTVALYFHLSVESNGNPSNDWFPSVRSTACGQLHFRGEKNTADLKGMSASQPGVKSK